MTPPSTNQRLSELMQRMEDYEREFRQVLNEDCAKDEKHCTCVPHLRRRIKDLETQTDTKLRARLRGAETNVRIMRNYVVELYSLLGSLLSADAEDEARAEALDWLSANPQLAKLEHTNPDFSKNVTPG